MSAKQGPALASMNMISYKREGALVAVTGVSEEGPYHNAEDNDEHFDQQEFQDVLNYAVAHELCHMLIGNLHPAAPDTTALMGWSPGRAGISAVSVKPVTRIEIDVKNKQSVP